MWSALFPYLGGKRKLCPIIFREIDRVIPCRLWSDLTLLDAFSGGGAASLFGKAQGFSVVAIDVAERANVIGEGLIANSRVRLTKEDVLRISAPRTRTPGRVELEYAPAVFTREQARFLDNAFEAASASADRAKAALYRLLAIRVAMLAHPLSQVRSGTIERVTSGGWESVSEKCVRHYVEGPRLLRQEKLWALARQINAGVFEGKGRALKADILDVLSTIRADIVYFDPPYANTRSYEAEYKTLDAILGDGARPVSAFSAKGGVSMIDELLRRATHIPVWVLSFGNAATDIEELVARMEKFGRMARAVEVKYAHKVSVASEIKKEMNREYVVLGFDPDAALLRGASGRSVGIVERHDDPVVALHVDVDSGGPEGPPPLRLAGDRFEKRESPETKEAAPEGRGAVAEIEASIDVPDAVLGKAGFDGDGEGIPPGLSRHDGVTIAG